ncbi:class I SAM-dependent methyltransferase [Leptolyngbya sp. SLC-A1]|uniref:SAM-dependent methyltransferase n=1 Tax=unclassified Leptolyngbya TaxID=2650499 RepID=UPI0032970571
MNTIQKIAQMLSGSPVFSRAERLWQKNYDDYWLRLSKLDKLYLGIYIILRDYSKGTFPPTFSDQAQAYEAEANFFFSLPGVNPTEALESDMRKPFWLGNERYIAYFLELCEALKQCGIKPPQTIVELGAGSGWMSEFLALMKFKAIATTIGDSSVEQIQKRSQSLERKGIKNTLKGLQAPMEAIDSVLGKQGDLPVNVVFVFEALHHAYDWQKTFEASYNCLKPGGWLLICREPNLLHTFVSYRLALLSNTHEIGMSRSAMLKALRSVGFRKQVILKNKVHFFFRPHWIAAQK